MPPKKQQAVSHTAVPTKRKQQKKLDYDYDAPGPEKSAEEGQSAAPAKAKPVSIYPDDDMDPSVGIFGYGLNYLEENMDVKHMFQVLILLFLANLLYLHYSGIEEEGVDPMNSVIVATCILSVAFLEFFAIINTRFRSWKRKIAKVNLKKDDAKEKLLALAEEKPTLPDFNYIYSVTLPLVITLLLSPENLIYVGICIVQISEMNVFIRTIVSYAIIFQFSGMTGDSAIAEVTNELTNALNMSVYMKVPIICSIQHEIFNRFIGDGIKSYEKTLLATASTLIMVIPQEGISDLTIVIMSKLFISFLLAIYISFGPYWLYKQTKNQLALVSVYVTFIGSFIYVSNKYLEPILNQFPLEWLKDFINENQYRLTTFQIWVGSSLVVIPTVFAIGNFIDSINSKRKIWHFILFFMILLPTIKDPQLVSVALFGISGLLMAIELIRATSLPPFGNQINSIFVNFLDSKDQGEWVTSYIYLILGMGTPLWLTNLNIHRETSYLGLITLGFGDSFASIFGKKFGFNKWPRSEKTMEGSFAFIIGSSLAFAMVDYCSKISNVEIVGCNWINRIVVLIVIAAFEGFVNVNDNLYVPLFSVMAYETLLKFN